VSRSWSPARALAWESLRLSWRPVVTTTLAWCALAAIYRRLLAPLGERRDAEVFSSLLAMMVLVNATTLLSCRDDGVGIGFERRLFRLPLSRDPASTAALGSWARPDHVDDPGPAQPVAAPPDDPVELRYRIRRAGEE